MSLNGAETLRCVRGTFDENARSQPPTRPKPHDRCCMKIRSLATLAVVLLILVVGVALLYAVRCKCLQRCVIDGISLPGCIAQQLPKSFG